MRTNPTQQDLLVRSEFFHALAREITRLEAELADARAELRCLREDSKEA